MDIACRSTRNKIKRALLIQFQLHQILEMQSNLEIFEILLFKKYLPLNQLLFEILQSKEKKEDFYLRLKNDVLNVGQNMWRTMEYGKFPTVNFKQAYFTYMPTKENDVYILAP